MKPAMQSVQHKHASRQTILSYLDDYLRRGGATMLVGTRGLRRASWSYERVVLTARRVACELEARGVGRGERVLLWGENSPEWVAAFWGCLLRGAVVVPLDKESSPEFVSTVIGQTSASLAFLSRSVHAPENLETPRLWLDELEATVAQHPAEPYAPEGIDSDALVEIIYTSGTTQTPKGVLLTHRNLLANLEPLEREIAKYLKWERLVHPIRFLNLVPLSHVFGQFMGIFVPQLLGGEVHFQDSLNPAEIVRRTREARISVIVLVPRLLEGLREWVVRDYAARGRAEELSTRVEAAGKVKFWRRWWMFRRVHRRFGLKFWAFLSGGATLDEETDRFWRRLGFAVLQGYGMTETASLISVNHPFKQSRGSIGKLMPGYEVKLDETGEIIVRGPSVSPGYWSSERGEIDAHAGGWLRTGDLGEMDAAGNLYFKGRKKDVIVTAAGLNVYPEDLEAALNREPEVRLSCVISWEGARGTEPLAVLILRDEGAGAESVVERANRTLAEHQRIRRWFVWDEPDFPRTATHKVIKREVAAAVSAKLNRRGDVAEGDATPALSHETDAALPSRSFILTEAARLSGSEPARLDPSANLATDLKLDSLGRVELLSALEDRYQIEIDEAAFTAATTVEEVEKLIRGETPGEASATPYPFPRWNRTAPLRALRSVLFYTLILPITLVMSRMRVEGREHLDELNTPALFVANHVTLADQALVLAALPARARGRLAIAMEGERLRDWLHPPADTSVFTRLRLLAQYILVTTFFNVFPLPKRSGFRRSFAYAGACVERGESVLVFPEGERARRGQMHLSPFKTGIGVLAQELSVPVVPVKLRGLYELKRRKQYFASPGQVTVVFGEPVRFDAALEPAQIAAELERRVAGL
ncbi:MAG TPA: AMP-binding protein [Pyrinomonadaceae bacterium]|nr:AMP-binding protein [Pyrinomonadaceae bacterium]